MRINKNESEKREAFVYTMSASVPPMSIADIQKSLANPKNGFGGKKMSDKRIREIKKLAAAGLPLPPKVYTRKSKKAAKVAETAPTTDVFNDPNAPIAVAMSAGSKLKSAPMRLVRWIGSAFKS